MRTGTVWSALAEAQFYVPQDYSALQLTEIHYNPPAFQGTDGERFEFLELQNRGPLTLDLAGMTFSDGVGYIFPSGATIAPNAFCVLVNSSSNFARIWPAVPVRGEYSGKLDNGGESLALSHPLGFTVFAMTYDDMAAWPLSADGSGASLQRVNSDLDWSNAENWIASVPTPGAPFAPNADTDADGLPDVWEVAYGTDAWSADADADPDGDGATNAQEYLSGTHPRNATSALRIAWSLGAAVGTVELHFTAVSNRTYSIEWQREAGSPTWMKLSDILAEPVTRTITVPHNDPSETTRFYRLLSPASP